MIIVCAWCEEEGQPAIIGERAPLRDDRPTHGICVAHLERYLSRCGSPATTETCAGELGLECDSDATHTAAAPVCGVNA